MNKVIPVACCLAVFTEDQLREHKRIWEELNTSMIGLAEMETGYQYQFRGDEETLRLVNAFVIMERKCCPFLAFTVIARNEDEPILLQLTGNEEVRAFIRSEMIAAMAAK